MASSSPSRSLNFSDWLRFSSPPRPQHASSPSPSPRPSRSPAAHPALTGTPAGVAFVSPGPRPLSFIPPDAHIFASPPDHPVDTDLDLDSYSGHPTHPSRGVTICASDPDQWWSSSFSVSASNPPTPPQPTASRMRACATLRLADVHLNASPPTEAASSSDGLPSSSLPYSEPASSPMRCNLDAVLPPPCPTPSSFLADLFDLSPVLRRSTSQSTSLSTDMLSPISSQRTSLTSLYSSQGHRKNSMLPASDDPFLSTSDPGTEAFRSPFVASLLSRTFYRSLSSSLANPVQSNPLDSPAFCETLSSSAISPSPSIPQLSSPSPNAAPDSPTVLPKLRLKISRPLRLRLPPRDSLVAPPISFPARLVPLSSSLTDPPSLVSPSKTKKVAHPHRPTPAPPSPLTPISSQEHLEIDPVTSSPASSPNSDRSFAASLPHKHLPRLAENGGGYETRGKLKAEVAAIDALLGIKTQGRRGSSTAQKEPSTERLPADGHRQEGAGRFETQLVNPRPPKRKRPCESNDILASASIPTQSKRLRRHLASTPPSEPQSSSPSSPLAAPSLHPSVSAPRPAIPVRSFPESVVINDSFKLFYRRFPVPSWPRLPGLHGSCIPHPGQGAKENVPRFALDLYTPRFTRGIGRDKVGLCPICSESPERGGEGKKEWYAMKFSAYKCYHMQYYHGISSQTGFPFSPPLSFRVVDRPNPGKLERARLREAKCHCCRKWVGVEGVKDVEMKVPELVWWKHAVACHKTARLEGDTNIFLEDEIFRQALQLSGST